MKINNANDIREIIDECRKMAFTGTEWHAFSVTIPELVIDFRPKGHAFFGLGGNTAIFVNENTFRSTAFRRQEEATNAHDKQKEFIEWRANETLLLSEGIFSLDPDKNFNVLGTIIHETGHAYNVAAGIANTEANAYLFEITMLLQLYEENHPIVASYQPLDFKNYFTERLSQYSMPRNPPPKLQYYIAKLKKEFEIGSSVTALQTGSFFSSHNTKKTFSGAKEELSARDSINIGSSSCSQ